MTLATAHGRRLCKARHADGRVEDYDLARTLDLTTVHAPNLDTLAALLRDLLRRRDTAVVRGAILNPNRARGVRRLVHPDPETGDTPTLVETQRAWLALDLDGLPLPTSTDPRDLALCGRIARTAMPLVFHGAACVVGATAGHGFKDGARLRFWFLLSRPLSGSDCKRWLRDAPVDPSAFHPAQVIYTAAPAFIGIADPLPCRLVRLDGAERVDPPSPAALAPPPLRRMGEQAPSGAAGGRYATAALARATSAVARASEGARHPTAVSEAAGLAKLVARGLLSREDVSRALDGALQMAGKPEGEGRKIVEWAVSRAGGAA